MTAENRRALRAVGEQANQRLCDAQAADARPAPDVATFTQVTRPSQIDGQHAPDCRSGTCDRHGPTAANATGEQWLATQPNAKTIDRHVYELLDTLRYTDRRAWRRPEAAFLLVEWPLAPVVEVRPHESKHVLVVVGPLLLHQDLNVTVVLKDPI